MGWWGTNVMEGDEPMDYEYCIRRALSENEDDNSIIVSKLKAGEYTDIIERIKKLDNTLCVYRESNVDIALQVLGEMIMCYGGSMNEESRAIFIQAAGNDDWATESSNRKASMDAYIERVRNHVDGVVTEPTSEGLLDKILAMAED